MRRDVRLAWVVSAVLGLSFIAAGGVFASGNNGQCYGTWTEVYDPGTDTWSHYYASFECEGVCPGDDGCVSKIIWGTSGNPHRRMCACVTQGGVVQFDTVEGGSLGKSCDALAHYTGQDAEEDHCTCWGDCANTGEVCEPEIMAAYWVGQQYRRDLQCDCN
jgi:hypothetical protein